jgi:hypothetical protein
LPATDHTHNFKAFDRGVSRLHRLKTTGWVEDSLDATMVGVNTQYRRLRNLRERQFIPIGAPSCASPFTCLRRCFLRPWREYHYICHLRLWHLRPQTPKLGLVEHRDDATGRAGRKMNDLVKLAIEAHGGLDQWNQVQEISARFLPSGLGLKQRGPLGEALSEKPMQIHVSTRIQRVTFEPFLASGQKGIYGPLRTAIESSDGTVLEELKNPRETLESMPAGTPWSGSQLIYFFGYSLWMYHTLPFSFLVDGVACKEVESWTENGETWRRLKVTYPDSYPSHSKEQIHYFDSNGIMRRQDYTVDVRQNLVIAHYLLDHRDFEGFVFATKRRICLRGSDGQPLWDRLLISADFDDFKLWGKLR